MLKRGGTARNIFVVLDGTLEVRDGDTIVNVLSAGDAFGEMAFLLERPRSFDVDAATDHARILSLSEGALRADDRRGRNRRRQTALQPLAHALRQAHQSKLSGAAARTLRIGLTREVTEETGLQVHEAAVRSTTRFRSACLSVSRQPRRSRVKRQLLPWVS